MVEQVRGICCEKCHKKGWLLAFGRKATLVRTWNADGIDPRVRRKIDNNVRGCLHHSSFFLTIMTMMMMTATKCLLLYEIGYQYWEFRSIRFCQEKLLWSTFTMSPLSLGQHSLFPPPKKKQNSILIFHIYCAWAIWLTWNCSHGNFPLRTTSVRTRLRWKKEFTTWWKIMREKWNMKRDFMVSYFMFFFCRVPTSTFTKVNFHIILFVHDIKMIEFTADKNHTQYFSSSPALPSSDAP